MRSRRALLFLVLLSLSPLAVFACDLKKEAAPEAGATSATAVAPTTADTTTAAPAVTATPPGTMTATASPGTRVVRLSDGGTALVNDAGQIITDAGKFPAFTIPSGLPSGMPSAIVIPTTMPSQLTIPSSLPTTFPPFPGMPDAGKK
jgi:hypothetical protein